MQDQNWAAENLQVIRTLMERAALYRRTLAPVMFYVGALGVAAAVVGVAFGLESMHAFGLLWLATALVAITGVFLIVRRQALKDKEPFWSPPTRRVTQALLPALTSGLFFSILFTVVGDEAKKPFFVFLNVFFYGCALHAAGFFMPRGMKLFGWLIIVLAGVGFLSMEATRRTAGAVWLHLLMGLFFGALHLAYGTYLYLTEKQANRV